MTEQNDTDMPADMSPVIPHLVCDGAADAIAFYEAAFGAREITRLDTESGRILNAHLRINGASVMLVDEALGCGMQGPKSLNGTPVSIHLVVPDVDSAVARAVEAGATLLMPVEDAFWGDRFGVVVDPFGHQWSLATPQRRLSDAEVREAAKAAVPAMYYDRAAEPS